jgi:4,5-dihydroxyphthalate decarboxylase
LKALLGDYPLTRQFKQRSSLEFADVKVPNTAFGRVVRDLEFDVAELALMTFLLAKAHGKPYRLLSPRTGSPGSGSGCAPTR